MGLSKNPSVRKAFVAGQSVWHRSAAIRALRSMNTPACADLGHRLLQLGVVLFLLGLLTGLGMPLYASPRLGLSSHLEGILNGIVLVGLGLLWARVRLGRRAKAVAFVLAVYGAYTNWLTTLLAATWGAGGAMMPIAGGEQQGTAPQELVVTFGLLSLTACMLIVSAMVLWGLRAMPVAQTPLAECSGHADGPKP